MQRRRLLTGTAVSLATIASGCLDLGQEAGTEPAAGTANGNGDTTTGTESAAVTTATTRTASPNGDPILLVVSNGRETAVEVSLTVEQAETTVFEWQGRVEAGARRSVDPGLSEQGSYELTVRLGDGTEHVRPFSLEQYDLEMGSNLIVAIGAEIRVLMEE